MCSLSFVIPQFAFERGKRDLDGIIRQKRPLPHIAQPSADFLTCETFLRIGKERDDCCTLRDDLGTLRIIFHNILPFVICEEFIAAHNLHYAPRKSLTTNCKTYRTSRFARRVHQSRAHLRHL